MNAPNVVGAPSVSARVAGTVPPTPPCVHSDAFTVWPLSIVIVLVSSSVPSGAVQVIVQLSCRKPFPHGSVTTMSVGSGW